MTSGWDIDIYTCLDPGERATRYKVVPFNRGF
jgi:hypothetical protein